MDDLFLFLDESGNYDFSVRGTKYLVFACLTTVDPNFSIMELYEKKHDFIKKGLPIEYFHASEDKQKVRDEIFGIIQKCNNFIIDSIVVEKRKVNPFIRSMDKIYPMIYEYLVKYICQRYKKSDIKNIIIFTDRFPIKRNREIIEKVLKTNLKICIPKEVQSYCILHHDAKSHYYLQIVDYCCWAVYRKWNNNDFRSYNLISDKISSEFDIFKSGNTNYY
ncbi:MAG: DUF3800 domain-containing protein [Actinobacteria bacterium]|nr:DUF3800 domain-containing protein [Actinomycetota bacterium]